MSMLSNQRDTLLVMADALEDEYPSFAREVRRAADTIWELQNKLAGMVDQSEEIERLKEQIHWLEQGDILHVLTDQELADQKKHEREMLASINALDDENAKLWELVYDMLRWMPCPTHCYHCERYHYPEGCEFEIRRRKLGIEVD